MEDYKKKYDELLLKLQKAKVDDNVCDEMYYRVIDNIVPELKESEDERVRKELLSFFTERAKYTEDSTFNGLSSKEIISWLEKQGKQKETLCDKCKKTQPSHSCQDITALGRCALEKQGEQKRTKFEKAVKQVMEEAIECGDTHNLKADAEMLLSLAHNSSWSEEDDIMKQNCHQMLALLRPNSSELIKDIIDNCHHWLKSLKNRVQPQSTWKPSDEQMKALVEVLIFAANHESPHWNDYIFGILKNLTRQLKKIREE